MVSRLSYCCLLVLVIFCTSCAAQKEVSVMSFNIRYDNPNDGKNSWTNSNRKEKVLTTIKKYKPAVLGVQEALHHQIKYLDENLKNYAWVGVGRDDGKTKGEFAPVFYDTSRFELVNSGHFWLSETPEKPSLGWDATCCNRITTWIHLKENNNDFFVFNTHYDHEGAIARKESSKLLVAKIASITKDKPCIITGDFNAIPNSEPLKLLNTTFVDTHKANNSATQSTFNGFKSKVQPNKRIDYIFVTRNISVKSNTIVDDKIGGLFPSDHLPVLSVVSF